MTGRSISIRPTIFVKRRFSVSPGFWLACVLALLVGSPDVLTAVLAAAAMHECGHLAALRVFRVRVDGVRLGALGAVIRACGLRRLSYGRELIVTLAGPTVNLFCAPLLASLAARYAWKWGYLFAGAHALLGVYNLLPVPTLDGGRALWLLIAWRFGPDAGDLAAAVTGLAAALALTALGAYLTVRYGGALFLLAALGLLFATLRELGLAKRGVCV